MMATEVLARGSAALLQGRAVQYRTEANPARGMIGGLAEVRGAEKHCSSTGSKLMATLG